VAGVAPVLEAFRHAEPVRFVCHLLSAPSREYLKVCFGNAMLPTII
jgi:hypothetical protein